MRLFGHITIMNIFVSYYITSVSSNLSINRIISPLDTDLKILHQKVSVDFKPDVHAEVFHDVTWQLLVETDDRKLSICF